MLLRDERSCWLIVWMVVDLFRSRAALKAEIWMLRQQINVLRRTAPKKQTFSAIDRLMFVCLYRFRPGVRDALAIVNPTREARMYADCRVQIVVCRSHDSRRRRSGRQSANVDALSIN